MGIKKQIPRKHVGKKVSDAQDNIIRDIQTKKGYKTYLEAKHEFFENQAKYGSKSYSVDGKDVMDEKKNPGFKLGAKSLIENPKIKKKEITGEKKQRKTLTINETKLGITMVLSKEDCKKMGFKGNELTRDAIKEVRTRLEI